MCKTLSSFEQLGSFLREMPKVETSLFEVLSDNKASEVAKKKAAEDLDAKVDNILMRVESKDFLFGVGILLMQLQHFILFSQLNIFALFFFDFFFLAFYVVF